MSADDFERKYQRFRELYDRAIIAKGLGDDDKAEDLFIRCVQLGVGELQNHPAKPELNTESLDQMCLFALDKLEDYQKNNNQNNQANDIKPARNTQASHPSLVKPLELHPQGPRAPKPTINPQIPHPRISYNHPIQHPQGPRTGKLRRLGLPESIFHQFFQIAHQDTINNRETCGILSGIQININTLQITHLIIPKQTSTSDSCQTLDEVPLFEFQAARNLICCGWIHTHPTQTAMLSSIDLHTHFGYQSMLPESIAIVLSPRHSPNNGLLLLNLLRNLQPHEFWNARCRKVQ